MKLHHVGISVSNVEGAVEFYTTHFGMELATPIFSFGGEMIEDIQALPGARGRLGVMRRGNFILELFEYTAPAPARKSPNHSVGDHGISHFGLEVEDLEGTIERMQAGGVRFHSAMKIFPSGIKATYGRDLDGNVFELIEQGPPPRHDIHRCQS